MRQSTHKLHAALRKAGLTELAKRAKDEEFHDYFSPHTCGLTQLNAELEAIGTPAAKAIAARVRNGDFDATAEESDEWAASPEGQAAFASLVGQGEETRDAGEAHATLQFRPLEDRVLELLWRAHHGADKDAVQTVADLITAACHAGVILNMRAEDMAQAIPQIFGACFAAQAQRPDIFGGAAAEAAEAERGPVQ